MRNATHFYPPGSMHSVTHLKLARCDEGCILHIRLQQW